MDSKEGRGVGIVEHVKCTVLCTCLIFKLVLGRLEARASKTSDWNISTEYLEYLCLEVSFQLLLKMRHFCEIHSRPVHQTTLVRYECCMGP